MRRIPHPINNNCVTSLFEDSHHRLWVGTDDLQWMDLNESTGVFNYTEASALAAHIGYGIYPVEIMEDPEENILVLS